MTKKDFRLEGMKELMHNINKELESIKGRTAKGMILAAIHVRRDMDKTEPKIPVDTGKLRASWFAENVKGRHGPAVLMGFSANYAVWVHENLESKNKKEINWNRQGSGPKFFQDSLLRNRNEIIKIIADNAQV